MEIVFISEDKLAQEMFPPVPAKKFMPEWYKNTPFYISGAKPSMAELFSDLYLTVKACPPVEDYMKSGYIIRAHADMVVEPVMYEDLHSWIVKSNFIKVNPHPFEQCPVHMGKGKNVYIKLMSPWSVKLPRGYSCYFYQPEFFLENKLRLFPGVVDADDYNRSVNFPGVVLASEQFTIKAGDPLMVVFPFKRTNWTMRSSFEAQTTMNPVLAYLEKGYRKLFQKEKRYD